MTKLKLLIYNLYSLFFCLRHLPFKLAIKIPILIHPSVRVRISKDARIVFPNKIWRAMLSFGFESTKGCSNCRSLIDMRGDAQFVIEGFAIMARGTRVVLNGGTLQVGHHFFCNGDCMFQSTSSIKIGRDNMYGWRICFNTSDGHPFYVNGEQTPVEADIVIGDKVWIASYCNIAKGAQIADGSVVAQSSLVTKAFSEKNILIGGVPAKKLKDNISWHP